MTSKKDELAKWIVSITPTEVAERYGLNKGTLANMRSKKEGPPYVKIGKKILYKVIDLEKWLFENDK